jgi:hypothetical protein
VRYYSASNTNSFIFTTDDNFLFVFTDGTLLAPTPWQKTALWCLQPIPLQAPEIVGLCLGLRTTTSWKNTVLTYPLDAKMSTSHTLFPLWPMLSPFNVPFFPSAIYLFFFSFLFPPPPGRFLPFSLPFFLIFLQMHRALGGRVSGLAVPTWRRWWMRENKKIKK